MTVEIVSFVDRGLGNSSYLVGIDDGRALAIDPQRDVTPYRAEAERRGWQIAAAAETHLHADFISGGRELQDLGATLYAPAGSRLTFDHDPLRPGTETNLAGLTLRTLPTPGHTPEHLAYLLTDGNRPLALFSGGSLLVGAVARTDLIDPTQTEELTRRLFHSLREMLSPLPDDLPVYPTHGAGSFCTTGVAGDRMTTLGAERASNPYLKIDDEDGFLALVQAGMGSYPTYYRHLRERNRRGPKVYGDQPPLLEPLPADTVIRLVEQGAVVVDARPAQSWAAGHVPGSLSIPLRDAFAPWLGWLVDIDSPVVFVLERTQDRTEVVARSLGIGYELLVGELDGGVDAWAAAGHPVTSTPIVHPASLGGRDLLDVRQRAEWEAGHIPDAIHIELGTLSETQPPPGPLAVHCAHGERAATGASLLERAGRRDVAVVIGGPDEWATATGGRLSAA